MVTNKHFVEIFASVGFFAVAENLKNNYDVCLYVYNHFYPLLKMEINDLKYTIKVLKGQGMGFY